MEVASGSKFDCYAIFNLLCLKKISSCADSISYKAEVELTYTFLPACRDCMLFLDCMGGNKQWLEGPGPVNFLVGQ